MADQYPILFSTTVGLILQAPTGGRSLYPKLILVVRSVIAVVVRSIASVMLRLPFSSFFFSFAGAGELPGQSAQFARRAPASAVP